MIIVVLDPEEMCWEGYQPYRTTGQSLKGRSAQDFPNRDRRTTGGWWR